MRLLYQDLYSFLPVLGTSCTHRSPLRFHVQHQHTSYSWPVIFNMLHAEASLIHFVHNLTLTHTNPPCFRKSHAGCLALLYVYLHSPPAQQLPSGQVNRWKNRGWDVIHTDPTQPNPCELALGHSYIQVQKKMRD